MLCQYHGRDVNTPITTNADSTTHNETWSVLQWAARAIVYAESALKCAGQRAEMRLLLLVNTCWYVLCRVSIIPGPSMLPLLPRVLESVRKQLTQLRWFFMTDSHMLARIEQVLLSLPSVPSCITPAKILPHRAPAKVKYVIFAYTLTYAQGAYAMLSLELNARRLSALRIMLRLVSSSTGKKRRNATTVSCVTISLFCQHVPQSAHSNAGRVSHECLSWCALSHVMHMLCVTWHVHIHKHMHVLDLVSPHISVMHDACDVFLLNSRARIKCAHTSAEKCMLAPDTCGSGAQKRFHRALDLLGNMYGKLHLSYASCAIELAICYGNRYATWCS
jgi:hypothetical protein